MKNRKRRDKFPPGKRRRTLKIPRETDHQDGWEQYMEEKWERVGQPDEKTK